MRATAKLVFTTLFTLSSVAGIVSGIYVADAQDYKYEVLPQRYALINTSPPPPDAQDYKYEVLPQLPPAGDIKPESIKTPVQLVQYLFVLGLALGGLLAFGVIVFSGIQWSISAGNESQKSDALDRIRNALFGLILLLAAYVILYTINPNLVRLRSPQGLPTLPTPRPLSLSSLPIACQNPISGECRPERFADTSACLGSPCGTTWTPYTRCVDQSQCKVPQEACPVPPLSNPPWKDPLAARMEAGERLIWDNTQGDLLDNFLRFQAACKATSACGSATANSAYRPPEYQNHLWEIIDRKTRLEALDPLPPECQALKEHVIKEFNNHELAGVVSPANPCAPHTAGIAVDITISSGNYSAADAIARQFCLHWRGIPNDKFHFELLDDGDGPCPSFKRCRPF